MNRRNVLMSLGGAPLLVYGMPLEEMPQSLPESDDFQVQIYFQSWPFDAKAPEGPRCMGWDTVKNFLENNQSFLEKHYGQVYWAHVAAPKSKEVLIKDYPGVMERHQTLRCDKCFGPT